MKKWQCSVCRYIHRGDTPPDKCPICGVSGDRFVLFKAESNADGDAQPSEPASFAAPASVYEKVTGLMVKHHTHPVSVHIPNGILPVTVVLFLLAWAFDSELFVKAGFINLIFVILALPFVLFSGIIEWKNKYGQALTTIFKIKLVAASLTAATCLISVGWYLINPQVLSSSKAWIFILVNIVMIASAGIAGHIGGKLVFKD